MEKCQITFKRENDRMVMVVSGVGNVSDGGRAIPYDVDANADTMVRYDPTATVGAPAPTAVARVTGKPEIEYRGAEKIQTAMKQTIDYEVNPQTSIVQDGNIEFFYPGTDCYVDLNNTYMLLQLKIVKADGTAVTAWTEAFSTAATSPTEECHHLCDQLLAGNDVEERHHGGWWSCCNETAQLLRVQRLR